MVEMDEGDDAFLAELERLVADAVVEGAARERAQARVLRQIAEESATFAGVALELAERGDPVVARTTAGRSHRGRVLAVGRDFLVVRDHSGPPVVLATAGITSLRLPPRTGPTDTAGARRPPLDVRLAVLLAGFASDRPRLQVMATADPQPLSGELRAVGLDVATIRLDGDGHLLAYVRIDSLVEVVLIDHP
ncbi:MAG: hypothetical protein KY439_01440 [Actinobacteria bacterium]|nr:hypothetical protein [Actinomycetota bacterium]